MSTDSTIDEETTETTETTETEMAGTEAETSIGLDENVAAALAYLFSPLTGLLYFVEDENEFVRFHAMQSLIFGMAWVAVYFVIMILSAITFGIAALLYLPALPVHFVMWAFLLYKAFSGDRWGLPVIGGMAEKYATPKSASASATVAETETH